MSAPIIFDQNEVPDVDPKRIGISYSGAIAGDAHAWCRPWPTCMATAM